MTLKQRLTRKEGETLDTSWGSDLMPYYREFGSIKDVDGRFLIKVYKQKMKLVTTELPLVIEQMISSNILRFDGCKSEK